MLKKISPEDSQLLALIHGRCFEDGWSAENFQEMLSRDVFFGFLSGEMADQGFILGKIICDELEIITFCVLREFRNRGIGKKLINEIDNYAQNNRVKKIFLEVSEDNIIARKIYKNSGYWEISRRSAYYHTKNSSADALVMQKSIH
jgi:ribosomal-protein-alanine N-acetyltransferase